MSAQHDLPNTKSKAGWHGRPARESRARCACHIQTTSLPRRAVPAALRAKLVLFPSKLFSILTSCEPPSRSLGIYLIMFFPMEV